MLRNQKFPYLEEVARKQLNPEWQGLALRHCGSQFRHFHQVQTVKMSLITCNFSMQDISHQFLALHQTRAPPQSPPSDRDPHNFAKSCSTSASSCGDKIPTPA